MTAWVKRSCLVCFGYLYIQNTIFFSCLIPFFNPEKTWQKNPSRPLQKLFRLLLLRFQPSLTDGSGRSSLNLWEFVQLQYDCSVLPITRCSDWRNNISVARSARSSHLKSIWPLTNRHFARVPGHRGQRDAVASERSSSLINVCVVLLLLDHSHASLVIALSSFPEVMPICFPPY